MRTTTLAALLGAAAGLGLGLLLAELVGGDAAAQARKAQVRCDELEQEAGDRSAQLADLGARLRRAQESLNAMQAAAAADEPSPPADETAPLRAEIRRLQGENQALAELAAEAMAASRDASGFDTPASARRAAQRRAMAPSRVAGGAFICQNFSWQWDDEDLVVLGELVNDAPQAWTMAIFSIAAYDAAGNLVDATAFIINSFPRSGRKAFKESFRSFAGPREGLDFRVQFEGGF